MGTKELCDTVIGALRECESIAAVELEGQFFSGVDIAVQCGRGSLKIFRLAIIEYKDDGVLKQRECAE